VLGHRPELGLEAGKEAAEHVRAYALDVTDPATVTAAVAAAIEEFGRIDVLVNNAGHGLVGALEELSEEEIHAALGRPGPAALTLMPSARRALA
jgi:NAD(P)-dependent dehydrogenase (short-subunit alcohol dehydrogenase family)